MLHRHSRLNIAESVHFVTTVTAVRGAWFTEDAVCRSILEAFEFARSKYKVDCRGYVLMPDHLHALLLQHDADFAVARMMESFKKFTSRKLRPAQYPGDALWRERFDDVLVPGADAVATKLRYLHENPLRRGLVAACEDYPWSSARITYGLGTSIVTVVVY